MSLKITFDQWFCFILILQVFIPLALSLRVSKIFQCIRRKLESGFVPKIGKRINYESLALGSLQEVQNMFATVVFNTVYPVNRKQ